jgi:thiamine biosynthesis lipoprotein
VIEINVDDPDKDSRFIRGAVDEAFKEMKRIESILTHYQKDSDISRWNRAGTSPLKVEKETLEIMRRAIDFYGCSDEAFDVTLLPILELWGFAQDKTSSKGKHFVPADEEIKKKLRFVGSDKIIIDEKNSQVKFVISGMKVDLGGIAKGFIVDKAVERLKNKGVKSALINAGGDIYCLGSKKDGSDWMVGIEHPRKKGIFATLKLKDKAVATSGDYQNYFLAGDKRYSHIFDPRTGYPVENNCISVTVIAPNCTTADALATAIFVLGPEDGLRLIEKLEDSEALIVTEEDKKLKVTMTKGLNGKLVFYSL